MRNPSAAWNYNRRVRSGRIGPFVRCMNKKVCECRSRNNMLVGHEDAPMTLRGRKYVEEAGAGADWSLLGIKPRDACRRIHHVFGRADWLEHFCTRPGGD